MTETTTQELSLEEQVKAAYVARQKKKQEEDERSNFTIEDRLPITIGRFTLVRVLDIPYQVCYSFIKCDNGKLYKFNLPSKENDSDYFLYQITDRVLNRIYDGKNEKDEAKWIYPMEESNPEIFRMIHNNGSDRKPQFGYKGWVKPSGYPDSAYYLNVINRMPFSNTIKDKEGNQVTTSYEKDWCYNNNHSLLLVKSLTAIGVPVTANNMLLDSMMGNFGPFYKYDIAIKRLNDQPYYEMVKAETLQGEEHTAIKDATVVGGLTEKDKALVKYDTKAMSQPVTYTFILTHLKRQIGEIDAALGSRYLDELRELANVETKESASASTSSVTTTSESAALVGTSKSESIKTEAAPSDPVKAKPEQTKTAADPVSKGRTLVKDKTPIVETPTLDPEVAKIAPHVSSLKEKDLALIKGVKDGAVIFNSSDLSECPKCSKNQPTDIASHCIFCGAKFE